MGIAIDLLAGRQTNTNMLINVSYHVSNICLYVGNDFCLHIWAWQVRKKQKRTVIEFLFRCCFF